jgi:hypothetical protein
LRNLLSFIADYVQQVYRENVVFREFAEKEMLVEYEDCTILFGNVVSLVFGASSEKRVWLYGEWSFYCFVQRVASLLGVGDAGYLAFYKDAEFVAAVFVCVYALSAFVVDKVESDFVKNPRDFIFA